MLLLQLLAIAYDPSNFTGMSILFIKREGHSL